MPTFILDLDDTLIPNGVFYLKSILDYMSFLYEHQDFNLHLPNVSDLMTIIIKENRKLVEKNGFVITTHPSAYEQVYRNLCDERGISPISEEIVEIRHMGEFPFRVDYSRYGLLPGVRETLEFLLEQGDELIVATKGEVGEQRRKMEETGLFEYIKEENFHVGLRDKIEIFGGLWYNRTGDIVYSVGDNAEHDINDATIFGMQGIYIPPFRNRMKVPVFVNPERVRRYERFSDIRENYDLLVNNHP